MRLRGGQNHLDVFFGHNNDLLFLSSPCKVHYSINNQDWVEGADINLMSLENAPLSIAVSILEVGHTVEISKTAYYEDLESIP